MVVDTDDEPDLCVGVCEMFPSGYCNGLPCSDFPSDACAAVMGAGRVTSNALGNEGGTCGITSGGRYIDSSQPDIYGTFQCLGYTGTTGSGAERQMEALQGAISEPLLAPGACNEGFLRDDAVLVITLITDEEDDPTDPQGGSSGTPTSWRTAVMAAKDDRPNSVVVLGLVGDTGQPGAICEPLGSDDIEGAEESPRLREFVEGFGSAGLLGSVCADSYAGFFGEAVDLIDTTCDNYVPPE